MALTVLKLWVRSTPLGGDRLCFPLSFFSTELFVTVSMFPKKYDNVALTPRNHYCQQIQKKPCCTDMLGNYTHSWFWSFRGICRQ